MVCVMKDYQSDPRLKSAPAPLCLKVRMRKRRIRIAIAPPNLELLLLATLRVLRRIKD